MSQPCFGIYERFGTSRLGRGHSIPRSPHRPHNGDRHAPVTCRVHDIGRPTRATRGPPVPNGKQLVRAGQHAQAGVHVRSRVRLDTIKPNDLRSLRDQRVMDGVMCFRQTTAILKGRHDGMKRATVVENRLREQGIRTVSETTQADQRATRRTLADLTPERDVHQRSRRSREPTMPSHRESRHTSSRSREGLAAHALHGNPRKPQLRRRRDLNPGPVKVSRFKIYATPFGGVPVRMYPQFMAVS